MLKPRFTGPFKKERKLMQKRSKDIHKLTEIMGLIINEQPLPPQCYDRSAWFVIQNNSFYFLILFLTSTI